MLTCPPELDDTRIARVLAEAWRVVATSVEYRAVGFGSHHWQVGDDAGRRWFVSVDDLTTRRAAPDESLDRAADRLEAALVTARWLGARGLSFVVAPRPDAAGRVTRRIDDRWVAALYPFVAGQSFTWGSIPDDSHLRETVDALVALHAVPIGVNVVARADDLVLRSRADLESVLDCGDARFASGPYSLSMTELVAEHAPRLRDALDDYDAGVRAETEQVRRRCITHGEPHPGNTMRTTTGLVLIDWDTLLVAAAERDLWSLVERHAWVRDSYEQASGVQLRDTALGLYARRWDLEDLTAYVGRFSRPHGDTEDDRASWRELAATVARIGR
ncbi:MAG: phosphotransferase [Acidimicrobiia bacterium]